MCWAFRAAKGGSSVDNHEIALPQAGRIVRAGQDAAVIAMRGGKLTWLTLRYGMMLNRLGRRELVWNARDDRLETGENWSRLIRQRFAVPVDAYVESSPGETWRTGPIAWMVGLFDLDREGGTVAITEAKSGGRAPILLHGPDARAWLEAKQWSALPTLSAAPRTAFAEADLFTAKSLEVDARTRVPLRRAA